MTVICALAELVSSRPPARTKAATKQRSDLIFISKILIVYILIANLVEDLVNASGKWKYVWPGLDPKRGRPDSGEQQWLLTENPRPGRRRCLSGAMAFAERHQVHVFFLAKVTGDMLQIFITQCPGNV